MRPWGLPRLPVQYAGVVVYLVRADEAGRRISSTVGRGYGLVPCVARIALRGRWGWICAWLDAGRRGDIGDIGDIGGGRLWDDAVGVDVALWAMLGFMGHVCSGHVLYILCRHVCNAAVLRYCTWTCTMRFFNTAWVRRHGRRHQAVLERGLDEGFHGRS